MSYQCVLFSIAVAKNHSQTSGIIRIGIYFLLPIWQWLWVCSSRVFFLWLTHSLASRSHWYSKPSSTAWEDFKVTLLVVCSPVHRLGKSFSKACFPHMKQEVDLDQTFPIHNNSTICRVKGGDFEIVHKSLATPRELCQVNIQQGSILSNGHFFDLAWSFCCI